MDEAAGVDRKVITALVARKLWEFLEGFIRMHESDIMLVLDMNSKTFHKYLLDVLTEACQLIKEKQGMKK